MADFGSRSISLFHMNMLREHVGCQSSIIGFYLKDPVHVTGWEAVAGIFYLEDVPYHPV